MHERELIRGPTLRPHLRPRRQVARRVRRSERSRRRPPAHDRPAPRASPRLAQWRTRSHRPRSRDSSRAKGRSERSFPTTIVQRRDTAAKSASACTSTPSPPAMKSQLNPTNHGVTRRCSRPPAKVMTPATTAVAITAAPKPLRTGTGCGPPVGSSAKRTPHDGVVPKRPEPTGAMPMRCRPGAPRRVRPSCQPRRDDGEHDHNAVLATPSVNDRGELSGQSQREFLRQSLAG